MKWNMRCPHCHAEFVLDESHQGAIGQCGNCGKEFSIPADLAAFFDNVPAPPLRQTPTRRMDQEPDPIPKTQTITQSWPEPHAPRPFPGSTNLMYCPDCGQMVSRAANECPFCGAYIPIDKPRPFLCGVLNIIGGFTVGISGSCLLIQLIVAGVEFFHPSENSYIREETGEFFKSVMVGFAIFFGGLVVLGISQAVAWASRRW